MTDMGYSPRAPPAGSGGASVVRGIAKAARVRRLDMQRRRGRRDPKLAG